ncbi:Rapamycin-insensitive companion of mTOR, N-term-domain-containing protein [Lipomyces japonicus]|uniref:Rapamycin-insensitive companion of mTOR, N-term-domain-containing protein n=1 Tax=Lipomyces japonicus TaxID=56871 RepID=UPI0034CD8177
MIKLDPINTNFGPDIDDDEDGSPTWALGDILQSLEGSDKPPQFLVSRANELVQLFQRNPLLKNELVLTVFGRRVQALLLHPAKEVVAAGFRVARYAITNIDSLKAIIGLRTDALIIKSLAKDNKFNIEREQAIKFIRAYAEIPNGVDELSLGIVCALVAVAEQEEDRIRGIAIETLAELLVFDPNKVSAAGGIKTLCKTLANGPYVLSDTISIAFVYLLDRPDTRKYIWPGQDLDIAISSFTELQEKDHFDEQKLRSCARVLAVMLKTWQGIFYMCMYNGRLLNSLVQSLRIPIPGLRDIIMDLLFDCFQIKSPAWATPFLAGRRLTSYIAPNDSTQHRRYERSNSYSLVDHYISLIMAIFLEAELLKFLILVIEENIDATNSRKAILLLGEFISIASKVLPQSYAEKTQVLGSLFSSAAEFGTLSRFPASSAIYQIDKITKNLYRSVPHMALGLRGVIDFNKGEPKRSELKKMKLGLHLDDTYFRSLLLETNVLSTKNYTKWNWETLIELLQGPLLNPKRLEEAIRATKFMKRLMSFYRPFKYRFSEVRKTSSSERYVKAGSILFKTLLANPEGVKYLMDNKLLRQVAECLAQLDPMSGITSSEPLLSKHRLETTLCYGYFTLLGTLSSDPNGIAMIERWRMFNMFYHLSELQSRKDLIIRLILELDYRLEGHTRIILARVLTAADKEVRMFATNHVSRLFEYDNVDASKWAIKLLVEQLYDVDEEVRELAVKVLSDACDDPQTLDYIVHYLPSLDHLEDITMPLLLRFLSTSEGFRYLKGLKYIQSQMDEWFTEGNKSFVDLVETRLGQAFLPFEENTLNSSGVVPPHFYRELVRTREGCELLRKADHVRKFADYVRAHAMEDHDLQVIRMLKGCLWAIGNVGSLPLGVPFLEEMNIIETIVNIANLSPVWSLKGTAFYVLGLISSTMEGLEMSDEFGWESVISVMGEPVGLCIPANLATFVTVPIWEAESVLRPSRRGVYVADEDLHLKQVVVSQPRAKNNEER